MKTQSTLHRLIPTITMLTALTAAIAAPGLAQPKPQVDPAPPAIEIEKLTNGVDCDEAPGLTLKAGETANWTYVITNVGGSPLYWVSVVDSSRVSVSCPGTETLEPGEMMTCGASIRVEAGPFRSQGVVAATTADGQVVDDSDPEHHFGEVSKGFAGKAEITIDKLVDGDDADSAPGPSLEADTTVTWTYVIANTGDVTLTDVVVSDSSRVSVSCLGTETLAPDESMTCAATATVELGPHRSLGLVTAVAPDGNFVDARDPAFYVGID